MGEVTNNLKGLRCIRDYKIGNGCLPFCCPDVNALGREERTVFLFREDGRSSGDKPSVKKDHQKQADSDRAICCKTCGHSITSRNHKKTVGGSHSHTFFNPAGIVYEIGCFKQAPGCHVAGESTAEFSWFSGYLWRFSFCSNCQSHLGWFYEQGESGFFGLILRQLMDLG